MLLSAVAEQSESKFVALQSSISAIITQNEEIKNSTSFMSKQYDDVIVKMGRLESESKADRCHIQRMEETIENVERHLYSTKIEIKNVPKKQGESKNDLCELVKTTASVLNVPASVLLNAPIEHKDIRDVFLVQNIEG